MYSNTAKLEESIIDYGVCPRNVSIFENRNHEGLKFHTIRISSDQLGYLEIHSSWFYVVKFGDKILQYFILLVMDTGWNTQSLVSYWKLRAEEILTILLSGPYQNPQINDYVVN